MIRKLYRLAILAALIPFVSYGQWQSEAALSSTFVNNFGLRSGGRGTAQPLTGSPVYRGTVAPGPLDRVCWALGAGVTIQNNGTYDVANQFAIAAMTNGDVIATITAKGKAEFDSKNGTDQTMPANSPLNVYLARYTSTGAIQWMFKISDYVTANSSNGAMRSDISIAPDGSIYVLAESGNANPTFYSADGTTTQPYTNVTGVQQYILKYNAAGALQWVRSRKDITTDAAALSFTGFGVDNVGSIYVFNNNVYKINSAGTTTVTKELYTATDPDLANRLFRVCPDGSWFIFDRTNGLEAKKYLTDGTASWSLLLFDYQLEWLDITISQDNSVVLAGRTETLGFITRYSSTGDIIWQNTSMGEFDIKSLTIDPAGPTIVLTITGAAGSSLPLANGTTFNLEKSGLYLMTCDIDGKITAVRMFYDLDDGPSCSVVRTSAYANRIFTAGIVMNNFTDADAPGSPARINGDGIYSTYSHTYLIAKSDMTCNEQYTLECAPTDLANPLRICPGSTFHVRYSLDTNNGVFEAGNEVKILLSDGIGDFTSAQIIGSLTTTASTGIIEVTVPENLQSGDNYRFRVWSTKQSMYSKPSADAYRVEAALQADFSYFNDSDSEYTFHTTLDETRIASASWLIEGQTFTGTSTNYTFQQSGTYSICFTITDLCGNVTSSCQDVPVAVGPCPDVLVDFSYLFDGTRTVTFLGVSDENNTFAWDFGDGDTDNTLNPKHTFATFGEKTVCLTATSRCNSASICKPVSMDCPYAAPAFTYTVTGQSVSFTTPTSPYYSTFSWSFGDATTATGRTTTHAFEPGTYTVTLTGVGLCTQTSSQSITIACVEAAPAFGTVTSGLVASFSNTSVASYTAFSWNFGDGFTSTTRNPSHPYTESGTYTVTLTATGKCGTQITQQSVVVSTGCADPKPDFTFTTDALTVNFTNTSTNMAGAQNWQFGDNSQEFITGNTIHTFPAEGTYSVCLSANNTCGTKTACQNVTVAYPIPAAPTNLVATVQGYTAASLTWTDNSTIEQWFRVEYMDTNTGTYRTANLVAPDVTNYTVTGLVCGRAYQFRVSALGLGAVPSAYTNEASAAIPALGKPTLSQNVPEACADSFIEFSAPAGFSSYQWSNGETTQSIKVTKAGQYAVRVGEDKCLSVFSDYVKPVILPLPVTTVQVNTTKLHAVTTADHYQWFFGNEPIPDSDVQTYSPRASGNYSVLITQGNCQAKSADMLFIITGIEQSQNASIQIYPVPASDKLTFEFEESVYHEAGSIKLFNTLGNQALSTTKPRNQKTLTLDVAHLPAGVYICIITAGKNTAYRKVAIE